MKYPENIEFTVTRYELKSKEDPQNLVVSFCVKDLNSGKLCFFETTLNVERIAGKTIAKVCQEAYLTLKTEIDNFVSLLEKEKENIIGYKFIPNTNV